MTSPKLIITHPGLFHCDETFSIALIFSFIGRVPIERRCLIALEELEDPSIWILDQGDKLEPEKGNFDHHQSSNLLATNMQILFYLRDNNLISNELYLLFRKPMTAVSEYDCKGPFKFDGFQVSELFKTFNNLEDGFNLAIGIAMSWIAGMMKLYEKREKGLAIFKAGTSIEGLIRVCSEYPVFWNSMGTEKVLVCPDGIQWALHSGNTDRFAIQPTGKELFLHKNKFLAKYYTRQDALDAARLTAKLK